MSSDSHTNTAILTALAVKMASKTMIKPTPRQNVCACVIFHYFRFACGVRFRLILLSALRCFIRLVAGNQQPQMKEKRTTNTKRYVGNNLLQLLVLEMGLLEIIFGPRSGRHYLLLSTVVDLFPFFSIC